MILESLVLVVVGAGSAAPHAASRPAPPRAGLSWAESDSLVRKLQAIEAHRRVKTRGPQTFLVTEGELNSYLNLELAPRMPKGVTDLAVRFDSERVLATGSVDLELVRGRAETSRFSPLALLSGSVPVQIQGRLTNLGGFGAIEWEDVRISSLPLPVTVLGQIVASFTRDPENPEGFDIQAPFRLPYSCRRVRLEPGRVFLDF